MADWVGLAGLDSLVGLIGLGWAGRWSKVKGGFPKLYKPEGNPDFGQIFWAGCMLSARHGASRGRDAHAVPLSEFQP